MRTISILIIVFIWATGLSKAGLITNITATDDGHYNSYTATKAVDGSGLDTTTPFPNHYYEGSGGGHYGEQYLSNGSQTPTLTFDLGAVKTLDSIHIWNSNDGRTSNTGTGAFGSYKNYGRGIHSVDILLSSTDTNGASFTIWKSGVIFTDAPASDAYRLDASIP